MADAKITRPAKIIRPAALRRGDKIGLIAPASSFNRERFLAGCDRLRQMGYEPVYSQNIFDRDIYFAGSVERRTHEFQEFWRRDDIAALICVRGGYGSNYLLEKLDYGMFAARPKILLGCSDITSLLTAIHDRTGLVGFHGPMVAKDIADGTFDEASWKNALQGEPVGAFRQLALKCCAREKRLAVSMADASPCWWRRWGRRSKSRSRAGSSL